MQHLIQSVGTASITGMADMLQIDVVHSVPLNLLLALQREAFGRPSWEVCLLPRPHTPEVGDFAAAMRSLRAAGVTDLPVEVAEAADVRSFAMSLAANGAPEVAGHWEVVRESLASVDVELHTAIERYAPPLADATAYVESTLRPNEAHCLDVITAALGVRAAARPLPVYLVPFAPYPPGSAFLTEDGRVRAAYLDYRRYSGPTMLEGLLTLLSWRLLTSAACDGSLLHVIAAELTGERPARRLLRANALKLLVALTAEHLVAEFDPGFRGTILDFGLDLRLPRLLEAVRAPWLHYLEGRTSRDRVIALINERLASQPASWFVEQVDAASLAADFYLLEWMAAQGKPDAAARLAAWQPRLAASFARHLDFAIGAELAHYDGIPLAALPPEETAFIQQTCEGNSLLRWPAFRYGAGSEAYRRAEAAFVGPGAEYGGEAWAPVARLMAQYRDGALSERIFIDQCFTLEHNNGSLFDKFFDTWDMQPALRAQACGDIDALRTCASAETGRLLHRPADAAETSPWPAPTGTHRAWPPPGQVGCGSRAVPGPDGRISGDSSRPVYRGMLRTAHPREVPRLQSAVAVLHTDLGPMTLRLDPAQAPMAVGTFVELARGQVAWWDPATGRWSINTPFYDDTRFHRIVPGFVIQAGDRTETGRGGPGFRYDEEPTEQPFDRPYLVAMVNTGIVTNGSQFFITLAPAPHLDGQYTVIGELADEGSRQVARQVSRASRTDPRIRHVTVDAR